MPRATTPLDPLEPLEGLEAGNAIPANNQPWLTIGQIVKGVTWEYSRYYLEKLLKQSGKLRTREILELLQHGKDLEYSIAGIDAHYALPTSMVCHQCYLQDGQCHSGLTWLCKVLIKGELDGKKVCVIPQVWLAEQNFVPLSEQTFQAKSFYIDNRDHVYKCVFPKGELAFVYVGHLRKKDGRLSWDNHITPRRYSPWQRRSFKPYILPEKILY